MTFLDEAPEYAPQIRSALAEGLPEQARKAAHAVKGRVGMLGMNDLLAIATELEAELQRGEPADNLIDRMEATVRTMCDELQGAFGAADHRRRGSEPRHGDRRP
jgi:HPt (histidine-containing phosphotransfer) domain-containing protein